MQNGNFNPETQLFFGGLQPTLYSPKLLPAPPLEGPVGHAQLLGRRPATDLASPPGGHYALVVLAPVFELPPEVDALGFGCGDTLCLTLAVELPLRLRHIAQKLEDDVGDQHACEIPALAGVQQGHIQHHDGHLLFLGQQPPLLQDLVIVPPQPVDALDDKGVPGFQFAYQPPVSGAVKILARLLVHDDTVSLNPKFPHGDDLPILVLILCGNPDVSVYTHNAPPL